jgi:MFS superfamily sulfate permease-like transporter
MRIIFNLISILMVVAVIFIASLNTHTLFNFKIWVLKGTVVMFNVDLANVILAFFVIGILAGVLWASSFYSPVQNKLKEYQRKLEKTSVTTDEESSKVAVLEEKIKTLEAALQSALGNKE